MSHMRGGIRTTRPEQAARVQKPAEVQQNTQSHSVGDRERLVSGLIGGGMILHSLGSRFSGAGAIEALIGAALVHRSLTGRCPTYDMLGLNTHDHTDTSSIGRHKVRSNRAVKVEQSVMVERPVTDLYAFWRQLDNLPTIMSHVRSVQPLDDRRSHWIVKTIPGAPTIEWDAEIINEIRNERIAWETLRGSTIEHAGSVQFKPADDERRTMVTVTLQYDPPAGPIGAAIASLLGQDPARKIAEDLERFKQKMESQATTSR